MWLDFVTYLHHHGHDEHKLPWYRGKVMPKINLFPIWGKAWRADLGITEKMDLVFDRNGII